MLIRLFAKALSALMLVQMLVAVSFHAVTQAQEKRSASASLAGNFAGRWIDQQNASIQMSVREDEGIFRITGGDKAYGYQISCLANNLGAACTGNGGRLEGQNFLYRSTFFFTSNGKLAENWRAFNNLQTVSGKTIWKRP